MITCRGCNKPDAECQCNKRTNEMTDKLKRVELPIRETYDTYPASEMQSWDNGFEKGADKQLEFDQLEVDRLNKKFEILRQISVDDTIGYQDHIEEDDQEIARLNDIIGTYQEWLDDANGKIKELELIIVDRTNDVTVMCKISDELEEQIKGMEALLPTKEK